MLFKNFLIFIYTGSALNQANTKDEKIIASDKSCPISPSPYLGIPRKEDGTTIRSTQKTHQEIIKKATTPRNIRINKNVSIKSFILLILQSSSPTF